MYVQHNIEAFSDLCCISFTRSLFPPNSTISTRLFGRKIIFQPIYTHVYSNILAINICKIETVQQNNTQSRQWPLFTYRAAEDTVITVNCCVFLGPRTPDYKPGCVCVFLP